MNIRIFTEYERNGFIYRAHPKYQGEYEYYDWANINWDDGVDLITQEPKVVLIIGRVMCFFHHPDGSMMAVVHSCKWGTREAQGVIGKYWHLEYEGPFAQRRPMFHIISVDCIQDHVCMIPYSADDLFRWIHILPTSEWPECFQSIIPPETNNNTPN